MRNKALKSLHLPVSSSPAFAATCASTCSHSLTCSIDNQRMAKRGGRHAAALVATCRVQPDPLLTTPREPFGLGMEPFQIVQKASGRRGLGMVAPGTMRKGTAGGCAQAPLGHPPLISWRTLSTNVSKCAYKVLECGANHDTAGVSSEYSYHPTFRKCRNSLSGHPNCSPRSRSLRALSPHWLSIETPGLATPGDPSAAHRIDAPPAMICLTIVV